MADSETDQEEMEEEIDEENNGDESEVSEVEEDEENDTRPSSRNTNKRSSTTGLSNHLKSKHNITKNQEKNQLTIHKVINNSEAIVYSKETFRKFLIEWIIKNDLPFTCVKSEDFRSMIRLLRKDAFIPSADTIKNNIISIFDESANIKEAFLKSLSSYNIESKILGVTTNNASNNITFLQAVEDELSKKFIRFESKDKHEAAINAINKLKEYYNKTDTTLYTVSLILDPRLKLEYMKDNEWEKCWIDKTKNDVSEIYNTLYVPKEIQNTRIECNSSDEDLVSHISKRQRIESIGELDHYLKADRAQPLTNVLKWWKLHKEEYPHLANMVKNYLGVPATSAPSERIFSSATDVITYDRASLAPETVCSVMCLKHWYRSGLLA
ncbi:unnamed protein product [Rhizophagus irregularis]|nr:unnamed protein product [Rhizophagus irregularis]